MTRLQGYSKDIARIQELMKGTAYPNSMSIAEAMKQLAKELRAEAGNHTGNGYVAFHEPSSAWYWARTLEELEGEYVEDHRPATELERQIFEKVHDTERLQNMLIFTDKILERYESIGDRRDPTTGNWPFGEDATLRVDFVIAEVRAFHLTKPTKE